MRCAWCWKDGKPSEWEQEALSGAWKRLCLQCARERLRWPWSALLPMRRAASGG